MAKKKSVLLILIVMLAFFAFAGLASCGVPTVGPDSNSESISETTGETVSETETSGGSETASETSSETASETTGESASETPAPEVKYTVKFMNGETEVASVEVKYGETIAQAKIPADPASDYVFYGWYNGDAKFDAAAAVTADVTYVAKFSTIKSEHIGEWRGEGEDDYRNSVAYVLNVTGETVSLKVGAADAVAATDIAYNDDAELTFNIGDEAYALGVWRNYYICNADHSVNVDISLVYDKPVEFGEESLVGAYETEAGVEIVINSTFVLIDGVQGTNFRSSSTGYSFYIGGATASIFYDSEAEAWYYSAGDENDKIKTPVKEPVAIPEALIGNWSAVVEDDYFGTTIYYFLTVDANGVYMCSSYEVNKYTKVGKVASAEGNSIVVKGDETITISLNDDGTLHYLSDSLYGLDLNFGKKQYVVFCYQAGGAMYADFYYAAELVNGKVGDDFALSDPEITDGRYAFGKWLSVEDNSEFNDEATFDKSIIFVGKDVQVKNAVTFKAEGAEDVVKYVPIADGVAALTAELIPGTPALAEGQHFFGWYNAKNVKAEAGVAVKDGDAFTAFIVAKEDYDGYWILNEDGKEAMLYVDAANGKLSFNWVKDAAFTFENGVLTSSAYYTSREKHTLTVTKKINGGVSVSDYYYDAMDEDYVTITTDLVVPELVKGFKSGTYRLNKSDYLVINEQGVVTYSGSSKTTFGFVSGSTSALVIKHRRANSPLEIITGKYTLGNIKCGDNKDDPKIYVGGSETDGFVDYYFGADDEAENAHLYAHKVGDKFKYVYLKGGKYAIATVKGEFAVGNIITINYAFYNGAETSTKDSVQYKITSASSMVAAGAEKGEYTSETLGTLKLDGFDNATLTNGEAVETFVYVINGAGVLLLKNADGEIVKGIALGEENKFDEAAAVGKYGYFIKSDNVKYSLTLDGFGGIRVYYDSYYPSEYIGAYTIGNDDSIVAKGDKLGSYTGTWTVAEGGKVLINGNKIFIAEGYTPVNHINEFAGYYVNGDNVVKIIVADGKATVLVNKVDVKAKANWNGTELVYTAVDADSTVENVETQYILVLNGEKLVRKHLHCTGKDMDGINEFETEYTVDEFTKQAEETEDLDAFTGTWVYKSFKFIVDGKGTVTDEDGNKYTYTIVSGKMTFEKGYYTVVCEIKNGKLSAFYDDSDGDAFTNEFTKQA